MDVLKYVAALAIFDGCFDLRRDKYQIVIADLSYNFLNMLCSELKSIGISCSVRPSKRDRAFRLKIYGKNVVLKLADIARELLSNPDETLLAAAIDAEGSIVRGRNQPVRVRIVQKVGIKADAIERALRVLEIPYLRTFRCGGKYVELVISNKANVSKLLQRVKIQHPSKLCKLLDLVQPL